MTTPLNYKIGQIYRVTKWLEFEVSDLKPKTVVLNVWNKTGQILGSVRWYSGWRQYTFNSEPNTTFNNGCLTDIAQVLTDLNEAQKRRHNV